MSTEVEKSGQAKLTRGQAAGKIADILAEFDAATQNSIIRTVIVAGCLEL